MGEIVIDTSALLPLFLHDEDQAYSKFVIRQRAGGDSLIAPSLGLVEFGNCILQGVRRNRLSEAEAGFAHRSFALLPISFRDFVDAAGISLIHALAQRRSLTFYDATYLALALNQGARLATLDKALKKAAEAEGVRLVQAN